MDCALFGKTVSSTMLNILLIQTSDHNSVDHDFVDHNSGAVVKWLTLSDGCIQKSLNQSSAQVQVLLFDNRPCWN